MVTLLRLALPKDSLMEKLVVSIVSGEDEQFTLGEKHIKNQRVNFYRECFFIKDIER